MPRIGICQDCGQTATVQQDMSETFDTPIRCHDCTVGLIGARLVSRSKVSGRERSEGVEMVDRRRPPESIRRNGSDYDLERQWDGEFVYVLRSP